MHRDRAAEAEGLHRRRSRPERVRVRPVARRTPASRSRAGCSTSCRGASSKACSPTRCRTSATATCRSRRSRSRPSACSSPSPRSRPGRRSSPSWGDNDNNDGGALVLIAIAMLAGILAFGARLLSFGISRHREELADTSAVALVSPDGLRQGAREARSRPHRRASRVARDRAPLDRRRRSSMEGKNQKHKTNRLFDTHPPLAERIAILRKLEGLDPNERGPVDDDRHRRARRPREADRVDRSPHAPAAPAAAAAARGVGDDDRARRDAHRPRKPTRRSRSAPRRPDTRRAGTTPTSRPCATGTARPGPTGPRAGTAAAGCNSARADRCQAQSRAASAT